MELKFLGTGTSQGVPVIGCKCRVCTSTNLHDKRFRSSVLITSNNGHKILIDCGPDFRQQMLLNNECDLDAILITHEHNDHIIGLDDVRPLIFKNQKKIPIYCSKRVNEEIITRFEYAFRDNKYPGAPSFEMNIFTEPFEILDLKISPLEIIHGSLQINGFLLDNLAYITDASAIPKHELNKLFGIKHLILNCIRKENPHPSHFILPEILELYKELKPENLYLTHISHQFGLHDLESKLLPQNIRIAFDGQVINF